ncbi:hypothetical protein ACLBOM_36670 [Escherichia coli]
MDRNRLVSILFSTKSCSDKKPPPTAGKVQKLKSSPHFDPDAPAPEALSQDEQITCTPEEETPPPLPFWKKLPFQLGAVAVVGVLFVGYRISEHDRLVKRRSLSARRRSLRPEKLRHRNRYARARQNSPCRTTRRMP